MPDEGARRESGGHGDRADRDAVLRRPRRAGSPAVPRVPAPRWSHDAPGSAASSPPARSPMLARHADGRPGPFGRCGLTGPADRRPVPAVCRRTRPGHGRPNALLCTNFARHIRRRVSQLDVLAGAGPDVSRLTPYPLRKGRCIRQGGFRPLPAGMLALTSAAICPVSRSAPTFLPDAPRQTVVPLRERYRPPFPGQTRAQQGPLDHPPRSPRGQGPATGTHHAT